MRRLLTALTVLMALGLGLWTAPPALAADARHHGLDRLRQHLGLNDDQVTAIQQIFARQAEARRQIWSQIREARREVRDLAVKGGDPATLEAKTADLEKLFNQALRLRVATLQEISPILTPEQREKFAQYQPRFPRRHGPRPDASS